ncbi:MAG: glycosyltransferase family 4 protein [Alphaproteobacteria bacterium]|nr:glycosyltransferase family 4 protein [Alphaproteobacteria bacterium]
MKILFAVKALDDISGGAERVLCQVASGLAARGHDVQVLSFDAPGGEAFYPLDARVVRVCLGIGRVKERATLREILLRMKALRRFVVREKPDVVVGFMHSMFVPAAWALIGSGVPVIASEHTVPSYYQSRIFEFFLVLAGFPFYRRYVVLSDKIRQTYPKVFQEKILSLPNPVFIPEFVADPAGEGLGRKVLLSVGRLHPLKDQGVLVQAFARLAADFPDWDLKIVGEGEMRGDLEALVVQERLEDRVFLPGAIKDISAQYRAAQIFVLPSRYEGFGLATAEAMAHGLPVVGFADCPGTNELITDGVDGVLVSGEDRVSALVSVLRRLMEDTALRVSFGEKGRDSVVFYGLDSVLDRWEELIQPPPRRLSSA